METEQTWKRPASLRGDRRAGRAAEPPVGEPRPAWIRILVITVPCAVVGIAVGVALASSVASPAAVAYIAAALFVAVLAFVTHVGGDIR